MTDKEQLQPIIDEHGVFVGTPLPSHPSERQTLWFRAMREWLVKQNQEVE